MNRVRRRLFATGLFALFSLTVQAQGWQFGDMAPVPQVTPDDVAHITAYVRAEQRKIGIH